MKSQILGRIAAALLMAPPSAAYAQETLIVCDIIATGKVNGRERSELTRSGIRRYILDDSSRTFTPLVNGERKSYCGNNAGCRVNYTDTMISYGSADQNLGYVSAGRIDRLNGRITETSGVVTNDSEPMEIIIEINGSCRVVTERLF